MLSAMQPILRLAVILSLGSALELAGQTVPPSLSALFGDPLLAQGQGVSVRRGQLDEAFIAYKSNLAGRGQTIPEEARLLRERLLLDRLIVTQILTNRATEADRAKATDMVVKIMADTRQELGSDDALRRRLKVLGLPPERYTNQVMEQALAQTVVDREVRAKVEVSPPDIDEFYQSGTDVLVRALQAELERLAKDPQSSADRLAEVKKQIDAVKKSNLARLEQPERVRVSHVMLATRDRNTDQPLSDDQKKVKRSQIEKLRTAALAGEDFQKLVLEFSEDRNLKETKGEYVLTREANFLPEFKMAAFALAPGQISEVLTTAFGYHILKVSEKMPAQKVPIEKARKDIQDLLVEQAVQKRMPGYFHELKQQAGVQVLDVRLAGETAKDTNPLKD